jgi:hypothetical protein
VDKRALGVISTSGGQKAVVVIVMDGIDKLVSTGGGKMGTMIWEIKRGVRNVVQRTLGNKVEKQASRCGERLRKTPSCK